jgi:hypothetical protein
MVWTVACATDVGGTSNDLMPEESVRFEPLVRRPIRWQQCGPSQQAFWTVINVSGSGGAQTISGFAPPGVMENTDARAVDHAFYYRRAGEITWTRVAFGDARCQWAQQFDSADTFLLYGCAFSFTALPSTTYELQHRIMCEDGSTTLGNTPDRCVTETGVAWAEGPVRTDTSCLVTTKP